MDFVVEEDLFADEPTSEEFAEMERLKLQKKNYLSQITQYTAPVRSSVYSVPSVSNQKLSGDSVSSDDEKNYLQANVIADDKKGNKGMDSGGDSAYESAFEDPYMRCNKHEIPKEDVKQSSGTECESGGHELDNLPVLNNEPPNLADHSAPLPFNLGKTKKTTICAGQKKLHLVWEEMQRNCGTNIGSQPKYGLRENPKKKVWPSYYVVG